MLYKIQNIVTKIRQPSCFWRKYCKSSWLSQLHTSKYSRLRLKKLAHRRAKWSKSLLCSWKCLQPACLSLCLSACSLTGILAEMEITAELSDHLTLWFLMQSWNVPLRRWIWLQRRVWCDPWVLSSRKVMTKCSWVRTWPRGQASPS